MKNKMISIIIPTYNNPNTIKDCVLSVINQSSSNWELIIVDDGSTVNTKYIVNEYLDDHKVKYYHQRNSGVCLARNFGVSLSKGNFLLFLDADDLLYPNAIKNFTEKIKKYPKLGLCSGAYWSNLYNRKTLPPKRDVLFQNVVLNTLSGSCIIKKSLFEEAGGYDPNISHSENWELFIRLTSLSKAKEYDIKSYDFNTFIYNESDTIKKTEFRYNNTYESFQVLYQKFKENGDVNMPFFSAKIVAYNAFRLNKRKKSIIWQFKAIQEKPSNLKAYLQLIRYMFGKIPKSTKK